MTDRDRLIELLQGARDKYINLLPFEKELIADYLLSNGVIVPPCKVGDTIYFDTYERGKNIGVKPHKVVNVKAVVMTKGLVGAEIPDCAFGKTVFLSREEAEKALERSNEE